MTVKKQVTTKPRKNSKAKGNSFELKVSKQLSDALHPLQFIRVPGSGARVGGVNFGKFGNMFSADSLNIFVGDVVASNESDVGLKCQVNIECKSYGSIENLSLIVSGTSKIFAWMKESEVDAAKTEKIPVVIFKWNRTDIYIASPFLPNECTKMILNRPDGNPIKVGLFSECLNFREFWIK